MDANPCKRFKLAESLILVYNEPSLDMGMIPTLKYSVEIQSMMEFSIRNWDLIGSSSQDPY